MKDEIKQELDSFNDDIHANNGDILNELRFFHILSSSTQEKDKESTNIESRSHIEKIEEN